MPTSSARDTTLTSAVINFNLTGDNTIIPATANQSIRVYKIFFVANSETTVIFKNGTTALSGSVPIFEGGAFVLDTSNDPWFETSVGSAFVINQSGAANVGGIIYYQKP